MSWVSIYRTNSQVSCLCSRCRCSPPLLSRFLHHFLSLPDLPSTGGTLSAGAGKKAEPQAAVADADADLEERLNNLRRDWAVAAAEAVNINTRISAIGFLFKASLAQHYLSERRSEAVWLSVRCVLHSLSLLCLISRFRPTGIINLPPVGLDVFYLCQPPWNGLSV